MNKLLLIIGLLLLFLGCEDVSDLNMYEDASTEKMLVADDTNPIIQATRGGGYGAVEILTAAHSCSGFMADEHMIVTARHCFDGLGLQESSPQTVGVKLNYADGGTKWRCMTSSIENAEGKCLDYENATVHRLSGNGDLVNRDLAAIFPDTVGESWRRVSIEDAVVGLYSGETAPGSPYTFWGRGHKQFDETGTGIMRHMSDTVDTLYSTAIETTADTTRICKGDSGGPFMLLGSGNPWVFAVLSSYGNKEGSCVKVGRPFWGTRLSKSRIENAINVWRVAEGLNECVPFMPDSDYWKCS